MNIPNMQESLHYLMGASEVERFHMRRTLTNQNIADHSFGVAMFCWLLTEGKPTANLLMGALMHDLGEHAVGDIPAPTKRALGPKFSEHLEELETAALLAHFGQAAQLDDAEARVLSMADSMECMLFCIRERRLGSLLMGTSWARCNEYLNRHYPLNHTERAVLGGLTDLWRGLQ